MKKLIFAMSMLMLMLLSMSANAETVTGNMLRGTLGFNGLPNQAVDKWQATCPAYYTHVLLNVSDDAPVKTPLVYIYATQDTRASAIAPDILDGDGRPTHQTYLGIYSTVKFVVNIVKTQATGTNPISDLGYEIYNALVTCKNPTSGLAANPVFKLIQNQ